MCVKCVKEYPLSTVNVNLTIVMLHNISQLNISYCQLSVLFVDQMSNSNILLLFYSAATHQLIIVIGHFHVLG
jgi:hypothetical protein